jgi:hypothetical protein
MRTLAAQARPRGRSFELTPGTGAGVTAHRGAPTGPVRSHSHCLCQHSAVAGRCQAKALLWRAGRSPCPAAGSAPPAAAAAPAAASLSRPLVGRHGAGRAGLSGRDAIACGGAVLRWALRPAARASARARPWTTRRHRTAAGTRLGTRLNGRFLRSRRLQDSASGGALVPATIWLGGLGRDDRVARRRAAGVDRDGGPYRPS